MKFDGLPSTNFTVAKYLARKNEVYYIEHPLTFKSYIKLNKTSNEYVIRKEAFKLFSNGLLSEKIDGINILISNPVFPVNFLPKGAIYNFFSRINEKIVLRRIKMIIKEKKISNYLYINFYDFHFPLLARGLKPDIKIYYCVDPIPHYYEKHGISDELMLLKSSDLVICTSRALYEEKKHINSNCHFVPNASDLVNEINPDTLKVHPSLKNIPKPIIGYIGAIERRIDYNLLKDVISKKTIQSFVFVGPRYNNYIPGWFFNQQNVYFIDTIPSNEIPDMIFSFDLCIIPFKEDKKSNSIFPLKLFEYLGIGKPVIITNFNNDLKKYTEDTVIYVNNDASFNSAIELYLKELNNDDLKRKRISISKKNTWSERVHEISEIVLNNLNH